MPVTFTSIPTTYTSAGAIPDVALYIALDDSPSMAAVESNGQTRLANLKTAVVAMLSSLREMNYGVLDIMMVGWSWTLDYSVTIRGMTDADFDTLIAWTNAVDYGSGTDYGVGVGEAPAFFSGSAAGMEHVIIFCSDGEPNPYGTTDTILASIPEKDVYCFNIELADTTWTGRMDNTASDGVPVIAGGDPDAMTAALISVLDNLITVTNPTASVTDLWPERAEYPQGVLNDPTVRAPVQDGKPLYRSGDEPIHSTWSFVLRHLTAAKKEELQAFQEAIGIGTEPFTYTDVRPESSPGAGDGSAGTYTVQLASSMEFDLDDDGTAYRTEVFLNEYCG